MLESIAPDLFRIPVPLDGNPLRELNAYLIRGSRNLLIDTGFRLASCREALLQGLQQAGVCMDRTDILLTHLHTDHTGLAPEIRAPGTRIFLSQQDLSRMNAMRSAQTRAASDAFFLSSGMPREILDAVHRSSPMIRLAPKPFFGYETLRGGDTLTYGDFVLRILHTPGHTPGHLCAWDEQRRILFSGDHLLFDITPNITRWSSVPDSLGDYLSSLRQIRSLPAKLVLPGHRSAGTDIAARADELIAHHDRRCRELLEILSDPGPCTAYTAASRLHWNIRGTWQQFPAGQQWFALGETVAHLDRLQALGRAECRQVNGLYLWSAVQPAAASPQSSESSQ